MALNMYSPMKIRMATGCSLVMFHGSKFIKVALLQWQFLTDFLLFQSLNDWLLKQVFILFVFFLLHNRMFTESCTRMRIMKSSEAIGLGMLCYRLK